MGCIKKTIFLRWFFYSFCLVLGFLYIVSQFPFNFRLPQT